MKDLHNNILDIWKEDVNWNSFSKSEKWNCVGFALSVLAFLVSLQTWMMIPSLVGMVYFFDKIKNLKIKE